MTPEQLVGFALEPLDARHLDELFALNADERVWTHLPGGRHTDPTRSAAAIDAARRSRELTGVGPWVVRERATGRMAGTAGVELAAPEHWNLAYRFHPDFQGRGLARAVAEAATEAARASRLELPVVARILETNPASIRLAERIGLALVWRGDVPGWDGATLTRRIHADRAIASPLLDGLIALG